ncbi:MAG: restriction endonuclease subunit S [Elusimicrobiota bacterium]|nr:restriction endonuclease subunit S [Elusimicrobiota bacterium]
MMAPSSQRPHCPEVGFREVFVDATGGNAKIESGDYLAIGRIPIIDQGQEYVAGFTNDESLKCKANLPCILFGDHTKIFKFVDKPFALGADGVKVLVPIVGLDPKYAYYCLQRVWFPPGTGYQRHFKYLQRAKIPVPPFEEQRRIAAILDKADEICRKRQGMASLVNKIQGSVFNEMFGDPVSNSKGWPRDSFGNLGELDRGRSRHRPRNAPQLYGGPYPFIQTGDVANCQNYIREYQQTYSELGLQQSRLWKAGTLCITIAANIAKTGILTFDACFPESIVGFQPCDRVSTEYVHYWLKFMQQRLENAAPESAQKNINLEILRKLSVPVPPIALQKKFSRLVSQTNKLSQQLDRAMLESKNMFNSLQRELF